MSPVPQQQQVWEALSLLQKFINKSVETVLLFCLRSRYLK